MANAPLETNAPPPRQSVATKVVGQLRRLALRAARTVRGAPKRAKASGTRALEQLAANDPALFLRLIRSARRARPNSPFLAQAEAIVTARTSGWSAAAPLFRREAFLRGASAADTLLRDAPTPPSDFAVPPPQRAASLDPESARRIVVYTAAFGESAAPEPVNYAIPGLRLLCMTDRPDRAVEGWTTVVIDPPAPDAATCEAWCRMLPHRALERAGVDADGSLYIAADQWLVGNLHNLLQRWCGPHDLVMWRSRDGADWRDLAETALVRGAALDREQVIAQAIALESRSMAVDAGAFDTAVIWRRHGDPEIIALMEAWWRERERIQGLEAANLYAALNDPERPAPLRPKIPTADLGPADDNAHFLKVPSKATKPKHGARREILPITFVYAPDQVTSATTELRVRQFGDLIAKRFPDRFEVSNTSETGPLNDRVVVLIKDAIRLETPETLAALRKRNIAVIGSWEDSLPDLSLVAELDADMTVSYRQARDHARLFPEKPSFLVGHHVNVLIKPSVPPIDRLRTGYFGHIENTHCPPSLMRMVDLVDLNVLQVNMSWIERLPQYNCHWIVRRYRTVNAGGKPFLKGFVAARCGAVVVVGRDDDDALQYLGDDYPFYVQGTAPEDLEKRMIDLASAFGGPEWRFAQAIMSQVAERSSDAVFCEEFRRMIDEVTA